MPPPPPQPRAPYRPSSSTSSPTAAADGDEDDYLTMSFTEPSTPRARETLTQRQRRQQRERELTSRPKSKSELAKEAAENRATALNKSLLTAESSQSNKGLRMMKMMGYIPGGGLGQGGRLEPIRVELKEDRAGIGHKRKLASSVPESAAKRHEVVVDPDQFRERVRTEREEKRVQALFYAAQKVCEKFGMARDFGVEEAELGKAREVPLKGINVLWRGLVKYREDKERERRMRYDMEQGLGQPRLPGYDRLHELDNVDKVALGIEPTILGDRGKVFEEDEGGESLEEEDEELKAFEELPFVERLDKVTEYLRTVHHYCFWCKWQYENAEMEGCPGTDEDSHG